MTNIRNAVRRLWEAADDTPMVEQDGHWVTWGEIRRLAERIDAELTAAGCHVGGRIAVVVNNRPESVAALLAVILGERTLVTLSPLQPPARLVADIRACGARYLLMPAALWSGSELSAVVTEIDATAWTFDGSEVTARAVAATPIETVSPGVLVEMLTSGTTGPPKRIPLSSDQMEAALAAVHAYGKKSPANPSPLTGSAALVMLPIVHIGGLWSLLQALVDARPIVMLERFTVEGWHAAIKEHQPPVVGLPPAAIQSVLDADIPAEDLAGLRAINAGTSFVDPALVDAFWDKYGIPILIVYGATEFCGAVAGWSISDFRAKWGTKHGSVGRGFPGVRLQVVGEDGELLRVGETGRLQVAAPQANTRADGENWVTTSDLAHIDSEGFLYIDGRADDVIVRGGFKIAPESVIRALRSHDSVRDAGVVGLPDRRLGHVPVAAVELRPGKSATAEDLRAHCRQTLTPYEVPAEVHVVDELPRGAALKVDRRALLALLDEVRSTPAEDGMLAATSGREQDSKPAEGNSWLKQ
jgi:acyl-coenzyme A synthetase/AMP-(fatty) acid ligase